MVRQQDGRLSSRHIRCDTCRGWVDERWYPRCHEISREVPVTGVSAGSQTNAEDGEWTDSTVEVDVVRVRNDPMTPLPRHNSEDSSNSSGDNTEGEDDQEIFSMCYQCNERVPIQMKENGSCHGRCSHCTRRQRHLVCAAVNPDKMIDNVSHSWCERCHQYVTSTTLDNGS